VNFGLHELLVKGDVILNFLAIYFLRLFLGELREEWWVAPPAGDYGVQAFR
jgi:hypothetical protein